MITQRILNVLRSSSPAKLSPALIAEALKVTAPKATSELLALRQGSLVKSWGSGTAAMKYWSV
jgi:hypothetical protein